MQLFVNMLKSYAMLMLTFQIKGKKAYYSTQLCITLLTRLQKRECHIFLRARLIPSFNNIMTFLQNKSQVSSKHMISDFKYTIAAQYVKVDMHVDGGMHMCCSWNGCKRAYKKYH